MLCSMILIESDDIRIKSINISYYSNFIVINFLYYMSVICNHNFCWQNKWKILADFNWFETHSNRNYYSREYDGY